MDKNILTGPCMFLYERMIISWLAPVCFFMNGWEYLVWTLYVSLWRDEDSWLAPVCVLIRAGNSLIGFLSELLVFCKKMSDLLKKQAIGSFAHFLWVTWAISSWSLIFRERPEQFAHIAHFLVSDLSDHSHRSPKMRESLNFWNKKKTI